jgi:glycolate oxidase FAD binding subunit
MAVATAHVPSSFEEAADGLAQATAEQATVRIRGAGTKSDWGATPAPADRELRTTGLDRILEHNAGDLTASLQAGVPLALAQRTFAAAGQMLALDPPLRGDPGPTIGGVMATGDSGPLRHRFGAARDLVIGVTVALSDGTIARAGGQVIKNVAGYDLAKLFSGSFGTLGLILAVNVRLHPHHETSVTALGAADDGTALAAAAVALARSPAEFEALDVAWRAGRGGILARCAGPEARRRAARTARLMRELGLHAVDVTDQDEPLWERQRAGQRSPDRAVVRIAARRSALAEVLAACDASDGTLVGRAALGHTYVALDPPMVAQLRARLPAGAVVTVLDGPADLRGEVDSWGVTPAPALELMRRVKRRFDPAGTCNPGLFVGGI